MIGLLFLGAGAAKLVGQQAMIDEFNLIGIGQWFRYVTGIIEVAGGIAILVPRSSVYGALLLLAVDLGAFATQLTILQMDWIHCAVIGALIVLLIYLQRQSPTAVPAENPVLSASESKPDMNERIKPMSKPKIALIIGSTRPTRFADKPAQWMLKQAQARGDMDVELVDLRDFNLPFFDEMASNLWMPSQNPQAIKWQETIAKYDGFIFVVAEYNRSITGALKNALDQAYKEWNRKAFTVIGYGGLGAARAVEHLRTIGIELQMVSTRSGVHIGGGDFMTIFPMGGNQGMEAIESNLMPSATAALDELAWWSKATMAARAQG